MRPVLAFRESFLREMILSYQSAKVFSLENFPLYGMRMLLLRMRKDDGFNFSLVCIIRRDKQGEGVLYDGGSSCQ